MRNSRASRKTSVWRDMTTTPSCRSSSSPTFCSRFPAMSVPTNPLPRAAANEVQMACKWIGPGWFLPAITLGFGVCSVATGFVNNIHDCSGVRFLLGMFEAGLLPGIAYYLSRWYRRSEVGALQVPREFLQLLTAFPSWPFGCPCTLSWLLSRGLSVAFWPRGF